MSAFKGTPGPWHAEHHSRGSCQVKISRPVGTKGMGPVAYALMDLAGAMTDERIAEMKANARLIAAAPELLEALQDCRRALELANFTQELAVVDAALSKATGGDA